MRGAPAFAGLIAVLVGALACSFEHGVGGSSGNGDGGPTDGVIGTDGRVTTGCDPTACGAAHGTCDAAGECVITSSSPGAVTCPAGMPCVVVCATGNNSCSGGVDCAHASSCRVTCHGTNACMGGVTCGAGACDVDCKGNNACQSETCPLAPASCSFNCCGNNACLGTLCAACTVTHNGC